MFLNELKSIHDAMTLTFDLDNVTKRNKRLTNGCMACGPSLKLFNCSWINLALYELYNVFKRIQMWYGPAEVFSRNIILLFYDQEL